MAVKIRHISIPFKERQGRTDARKNNLPDNCLAVVNPELAEEWHPTKNGELTPEMVTAGSKKKVWWKCKRNHEWIREVSVRNRGNNCPYCSGQKVLKGYNDLATINPSLATEWNPTKNGELTPEMVTAGSGKKVWWQCKRGHEWKATINSRDRGYGCPYCSGRRAIKGINDLLTTNSELAAEWHPTKNGNLTPEMVTKGSEKKVWWQCSKGHEWRTMIANRNRGAECPYCSGHKVLKGFNDLATTNPELAAEWHPTKNGNLTPEMVIRSSNKKVWWLGECRHEWESTINNRSKSKGCPYCYGRKVLKGFNDLATINPELAAEWHPTKNGNLTPKMVTRSSNKKVWWLGKCGHEWEAVISNRSKGVGCPICNGESHTSFAEQATYYYIRKAFPDAINRDFSFGKELDVYIPSVRVAIEYDGSYFHKNVRKDEQKNTWCKKHGIRMFRIREYGCPYIEGEDVIVQKDYKDSSLEEAIIELLKQLGIQDQAVDINADRLDIYDSYIINIKENSFAVAYPDLSAEWHPTKNGNLKPDMVAKSSNKKVWWFGKCGHEWQSTINNRSSGNGCPYCSGRKVLKGVSDLSTVNPKLAAEWHPTKNGSLTPDMVMAGSTRKVWWQCEHGHEWQATIYSKNNGYGCPYCSGQKVLKGVNDLATVNSKLASEWHSKKNDNLTPDMVMAGSTRKVWWQCRQGHEWQATIVNRNKGNGCPYCSGRKVLKGFNDLATVNPELVSEWHPSKNGSLTPDMVTRSSGRKVWWQCRLGHEWQAKICHRSNGSDCPYCSGHEVLKGFNDLATINPELASEWHPSKNTDLTPDMVTKGSHKKVWWQCKQGHEWRATIHNRSNGCGCPICRKSKNKQ